MFNLKPNCLLAGQIYKRGDNFIKVCELNDFSDELTCQENTSSNVSLSFDGGYQVLDNTWELFKPSKIEVGQVWALTSIENYDWERNVKVRIDSLNDSEIKVTVVSTDQRRKFFYHYGTKTTYYIPPVLKNKDIRIVSFIPECYNCLCYFSKNYLSPSFQNQWREPFICVACKTKNI